MSAQQTFDQVLAILYKIKEDDEKLTRLFEFMVEEFLEADDENQEERNHLELIPEKYRDIVKEIADNMSANLISYFNPDTQEIEFIPKDVLYGGFDEFEDSFPLTNEEWDNCITIEPLDSRESYEIMESFVNHLKDKKEASKLSQALNGRKPFANFNHQIHNSDYREDWFAFRQKELEKYVINNYFYDIENLEN